MKRRLLVTLLCSHVSVAQAESADLTSRGAALFAARCAGICHQTPQAARFTEKQWQIVLNTMQTRITTAGLAPLTDEEQRAILQYLTSR